LLHGAHDMPAARRKKRSARPMRKADPDASPKASPMWLARLPAQAPAAAMACDAQPAVSSAEARTVAGAEPFFQTTTRDDP
jgi:hypothetical protein